MVRPVPRIQASSRSRSAAPSERLDSMTDLARSSAASPPSSWNVLRADSNALAASLPSFLTTFLASSSKFGSRPYRWLKRRATSRVSSTCDDWSSPDRHVSGLVDQDVGGLQQRVAEEAVGREVAVLQLVDLVLVGRHPLEPAERRAHRQQREQLGVLGQAALDEDGRVVGVDAGGEPVDHHVVDVVLDDVALLVVRRQRVPVGDEVEAVVEALQAHPVLQRAVVVAEVQGAGRAHAGQDALAARSPRRRPSEARARRRGNALAHRLRLVIGQRGAIVVLRRRRADTLGRA